VGEESRSASKVLVVDDEDALRRALCKFLSRAGHRAIEARNGREATDMLARERFDAVVSDIAMPEMDGIQLLRAVRERDADVPVILITGAPDVSTAIAAVELGVYRYVTKPFEPADLVDLVGRAVKLGRVARIKREAIEVSGQGLGSGDRAGTEAAFARALDTLWLAYQPIVRASEPRLFGYEALLRSQEPTFPHPGAVIDAAERLGRLDDLGRRIRDRAAAPIAARSDQALLFVNLHPRDLVDDSLLSPDAPLSKIADRVVLEITERSSLSDVKDLAPRLATLRSMGFRLAVDDLGAGYAGLTSFAQLEPEIVKLDMSLVRDVHVSETKRKVIRSMASLCREMGMLVVAEGVENAQERNVLVDLGCDLLQGYLFAKPGRPFPEFSWDGAPAS